jgi:hypothetical protein
MTKIKRVVAKDWTDQEMITVRKMFREGFAIDDAMETIATTMSKKTFRQRCLGMGIRFNTRPSIHKGTSVLNKEKESNSLGL